MQTFSDLASLREAVPYPLRLPSYVPEGYAFHEAMLTPTYRALIAYRGPENALVFCQLPVGRQPTQGGERPIRAVVEMLTEASIVPVPLNGGEAAWVGERALMWEADGTNYVLGGIGLSIEEALRVANSLSGVEDAR